MIENAKDVVYISATYSKRPDNMPLYALKTSIREANLSYVQLTEAYQRGDVALQEATTSELVKIGQLVRRQKLIQGKTEYIPKNVDDFIEKHAFGTTDEVIRQYPNWLGRLKEDTLPF